MGVRNQNSCFLTTKDFLLKQRESTSQLKMSYSSTLTFVQDSLKPLIAKKLIGIPLFS